MRPRLLLKLCLLLLAGAIVNVAVAWENEMLGPPLSYWDTEVIAGFPVSSMRGKVGELYEISFPNRSTFLPLQPLFPGFAINTIFYAAILWVLFAAPFKVRRWGRRRRGQCPACGYTIGTSPVCTECGKPVRARMP